MEWFLLKCQDSTDCPFPGLLQDPRFTQTIDCLQETVHGFFATVFLLSFRMQTVIRLCS